MSSTEALEVSLYGKPAGVIESRGRSTRFYFYDSYIESPDRAVLGLRFEENIRAISTGQDRLPTWFSNVLPEGPLGEIVRSQLQPELDRPPSEVDVLTRLGLDLPGAVTVRKASVTPIHDGERIENAGAPSDAGSDTSIEPGLRFSMAGVGMKFSMLRNGDRFTAPAAGLGGDWLVKTPDRNIPHLPINEYATMRLAISCGITAPEVRLIPREQVLGVPGHVWSGESYAYAVRRFDRTGDGLIHIEDLAQVRGVYPVNKYTGTFETAASLYYRGFDHSSLVEFVKRLAFNIAIGNGDAHLKNWSLIYYDRRRPVISPAYDLVSVEAYRDRGLQHDLGLRFGRSKRYDDVQMSFFGRLGRKLGARSAELESVARDLFVRVAEHWDQYEEDLYSASALIEPARVHWQFVQRQLFNR